MEIIFVTVYKHKFMEFENFLDGHKLIQKDLDTIEIQGNEEEIVKHKAKEAYKKLGKPCVVEDTSLGFEAWKWLPGPYAADFNRIIGVENYSKLLLDNNKAKATCVIGFARSEDDIVLLFHLHLRKSFCKAFRDKNPVKCKAIICSGINNIPKNFSF